MAAIWNHRYDVYLGTDPTNLSRVGENLAVAVRTLDRHETWLVPADSVTGYQVLLANRREDHGQPHEDRPDVEFYDRRIGITPGGRPQSDGDGHGANPSLAGVERRGWRDPGTCWSAARPPRPVSCKSRRPAPM